MPYFKSLVPLCFCSVSNSCVTYFICWGNYYETSVLYVDQLVFIIWTSIALHFRNVATSTEATEKPTCQTYTHLLYKHKQREWQEVKNLGPKIECEIALFIWYLFCNLEPLSDQAHDKSTVKRGVWPYWKLVFQMGV